MTARTAIITGGAGGLGLAMARGLLADGHRVALIDNDAAATERARDALGGIGAESLAVVADVSDEAAVAAAVGTAVEAFGPIEILINNAGIGPSSIRPDAERRLPGVAEVTPELWSRFFAVNLTGSMFMLRAVLPGMQAGGWGRVINNTTSFFTMLRVLPYGATKAALESMSAVWAKELAGTGITANVLIPGGPTDTAFIADGSGIPRDQMLKPAIMGPPASWLMSDASHAMTGQRIIAARWDPALRPAEAAIGAARAIGWPELATDVVWPGGGPA